MEPTIVVLLLALLFALTHVGLATLPVRNRLVAALGGEWGFRGLFFAVAGVTFTLATAYYADHRLAGAPGLALGQIAVLRWPLIGLVVLGVMLMVAAFSSYASSPYGRDDARAHAPRGLERITRHPFFVGLAMFAIAHALLATRLTATALMTILALLSMFGAWHQDRKLARLRGETFTRYLEVTSAIPFVAIAARRQSLVWRELPVGALGVGLAVAVALRSVHASIFAHHGVWVSLVVVGGAVVAGVAAYRKDRRHRGQASRSEPAAALR